jgi:two-component system, NtrC family, sensor kinase
MTTQSRRRFTQIVLGLVTLLLASTLVFLYLKAARDQTASYTQSRDLIRQLQQCAVGQRSAQGQDRDHTQL